MGIRSFIGRFITAEKIEATKELLTKFLRLGVLTIEEDGDYSVEIGNTGSLRRVYLAPNSNNENQIIGVGPVEQILLGAQLRHTVSYVGKVNDTAFRREEFLWDSAYRQTCEFTADTDCVIEVVFSETVVLGEGLVAISFSGTNKPDVSMSLEVRKNSTWTEVKAWEASELALSNFFTAFIAQNQANPYEGIRLNFRGTSPIYITAFENYLSKGDGDFLSCVMSATSDSQDIYSPSISIRDLTGSNITTIGQGTLSASSIPEYADDTAADAALSSGDIYRLTGNRTLYIIP